MVSDDDLVGKALEVMKNAYCPYSKFPVGAALLCEDNTVIVGVNVENASYGGTICAERAAVTSAISQGKRKFKAIAIVTELAEPAASCGLCRQFMIEFGNIKCILGCSTSDKRAVVQLRDLLPQAFTPASLEEHVQQ